MRSRYPVIRATREPSSTSFVETSSLTFPSLMPSGVSSADRRRASLHLTGVGHRWSLYDVRIRANQRVIVLRMDVGTSEPRCYVLPSWVDAQLNATSTELTLTVSTREIPSDAHAETALGKRCHRLKILRPRSPYTGHGIIDPSFRYRKLKSTKTSKK